MSKNSGHQDTRFYLNIYRMEIERVKYLLKSYLRSRIIKIENQLIYLIEKDQAHLLSQSEMEYAWNLSEAKKEVYQKDFFNKISKTLNPMENMPDGMSKYFQLFYLFSFSHQTKFKTVCVC